MSERDDVINKHEQILYPTVRVSTSRGGGSGTVLFSGKDKSDMCVTMILTNHHVIEDCIEVKDNVWDQRLGKSVKREFKQAVKVEFFHYNDYSHCIGSRGVDADIIAYDALQDIALLKLRDKENIANHVARIIPTDKLDTIHIFDQVWCCGAALGHPPLPTMGYIGGLDDEYDNYKYGLSSASTVYGSSGGALFKYSADRDMYEYIGMPAMCEVSFTGFSPSLVSHMSYFIPIERIIAFLDENCYTFIYDREISIEQCNKNRDKVKMDSRTELERNEGVVG